jgi:hypothetical protein
VPASVFDWPSCYAARRHGRTVEKRTRLGGAYRLATYKPGGSGRRILHLGMGTLQPCESPRLYRVKQTALARS